MSRNLLEDVPGGCVVLAAEIFVWEWVVLAAGKFARKMLLYLAAGKFVRECVVLAAGKFVRE